jgi:hypothetical protein
LRGRYRIRELVGRKDLDAGNACAGSVSGSKGHQFLPQAEYDQDAANARPLSPRMVGTAHPMTPVRSSTAATKDASSAVDGW